MQTVHCLTTNAEKPWIAARNKGVLTKLITLTSMQVDFWHTTGPLKIINDDT